MLNTHILQPPALDTISTAGPLHVILAISTYPANPANLRHSARQTGDIPHRRLVHLRSGAWRSWQSPSYRCRAAAVPAGLCAPRDTSKLAYTFVLHVVIRSWRQSTKPRPSSVSVHHLCHSGPRFLESQCDRASSVTLAPGACRLVPVYEASVPASWSHVHNPCPRMPRTCLE